MVLSLIWGIFLFFGAVVFYIYDILLRKEEDMEFSPLFNVIVTAIGIVSLAYFIVDIKLYISRLEKRAHGNLNLGDLKLIEGEDGDWHVELPLPGEKEILPEYYGFVSGRHAGSFYLKIGAGFFCSFHLVHLTINIIKSFTFSNFGKDETLYELCGDKVRFSYEILIIIFVMLQFYVIFKFGNVIVNKNRALARLSFMHCLATSLSFWAYTLVNETIDVLVKKTFYYDDCDDKHYNQTFAIDDDLHPLYHNCSGKDTFSCTLDRRFFCVSSNKMADGLFGAATFLYPFSIEFNILVVGVWYILWSNIGNISDHKESLSFLPSVTPKGSMEALHKSQTRNEAMVIFADCKSSITGLILGTLVFILTIVIAILIFVLEDSCDDNLLYASDDIGYTLESTLLVLMIGVSIYVYYKLAKFEVNLIVTWKHLFF